MCPTMEEYSIILGVNYNTEVIVTPTLNQGFRSRISKVMGIKKGIVEKGNKENKCTLSFLFCLFIGWDTYQKIWPAFCSSREDWSQNCMLSMEFAILGQVLLFLRNLEKVDKGLLEFREKIEKGHTFVSPLLAYT